MLGIPEGVRVVEATTTFRSGHRNEAKVLMVVTEHGVAERGGDALLERSAELDRIAACVEAARRGSGALLVVEGAAGIGKTRLLAAARTLAVEQGVRVL